MIVVKFLKGLIQLSCTLTLPYLAVIRMAKRVSVPVVDWARLCQIRCSLFGQLMRVGQHLGLRTGQGRKGEWVFFVCLFVVVVVFLFENTVGRSGEK